jgi:hypothetical protein
MTKLRCHISISLDGFVAGPNQSEENPLGEGGERLHDWVVPLAAWRHSHDEQGGEVNESTRIVEESRNSSSTSFRCCSATVLASSTTSGTRKCTPSRSEPSKRPA